MWPPTLTACECPQPGWCERHQCQKTPEWHFLCRRISAEYDRWERGDGPCVNRPHPVGNVTPLPPCRHRSLDPAGHVECELCGQRKVLVPVFVCAKYGQCTERRFGNRSSTARQMHSCLTCSEYQPSEESEF